jgi:hypothetical protein
MHIYCCRDFDNGRFLGRSRSNTIILMHNLWSRCLFDLDASMNAEDMLEAAAPHDLVYNIFRNGVCGAYFHLPAEVCPACFTPDATLLTA